MCAREEQRTYRVDDQSTGVRRSGTRQRRRENRKVDFKFPLLNPTVTNRYLGDHNLALDLRAELVDRRPNRERSLILRLDV